MAKRKSSNKTKGNGQVARKWGNDTAITVARTRISLHPFTRLVNTNDLVVPVADVGYGISFSLSDVPNYTEFTALFDQFRMDWVEYTFIKKSEGPLQPIIYLAQDHDSDHPPSYAEMMERQSTQVLTFGSDRTMLKYRFRPNPLRQVFASALGNGYERAPNGTWLDCSYASSKHYGLKYWIQNYNSTTNPGCSIQVSIRYGLTFKEAQ